MSSLRYARRIQQKIKYRNGQEGWYKGSIISYRSNEYVVEVTVDRLSSLIVELITNEFSEDDANGVTIKEESG